MALVVLMLFAISVTGAAAWLTVSTEFVMARYQTQGRQALAIAEGGLRRFAAEQLGGVADSARYAIGDGEAFVRARKIAEVDAATDVYYLRSEGTVIDPAAPASPAVRVVGAYAYLRKRPMALHAAVIVDAQVFRVQPPGGRVSGDDVGAPDCGGVTAPSITGAIARGNVAPGPPGSIVGDPPSRLWPGGHTAILDSLRLRWDVLSDPSFPVAYEDAPPNFGALPADAFPLVRYNGSLSASGADSGRGVLLVTGQFDAGPGFHWSGIVLAGRTAPDLEGTIDGVLVGGLSGTQGPGPTAVHGSVRYHSCNVARANEALSYLELDARTVFEAG